MGSGGREDGFAVMDRPPTARRLTERESPPPRSSSSGNFDADSGAGRAGDAQLGVVLAVEVRSLFIVAPHCESLKLLTQCNLSGLSPHDYRYADKVSGGETRRHPSNARRTLRAGLGAAHDQG